MAGSLQALCSRGKLVLGVVHLPPLPGSPRYTDAAIRRIVTSARNDAEALLAAGFHGYVLENFGDLPFFAGQVPPHVIAFMTRIASELPRAEAFVVVNVLRNDAQGALSIAAAAELDAIRVNVHTGAMVTDQGIIEGKAAETLRLRRAIAPEVQILADVDVKHAAPLAGPFDRGAVARDTAYRGLADALIVTGKATGAEPLVEDLRAVRQAVPDRPVLVGSGTNEKTVADWLREVDGVIVGSAVKQDGRAGNPVDAERAKRFFQAATG